MKTRFAPSPTGYLHIGNMRTALLCYLYARNARGEFLLRIDDTDTQRSEQKYVDAIKRDLNWLGIEWNECVSQSSRMDSYNEAVEKLKSQGRLYACYETGQELDIKRKMQRGRGLPPIYDREGLNLSEEKLAKYKAEGRTAHYRFKLEDKNIAWRDEIKGDVSFGGRNMSDPILIRENGAYTYMLPSTVDDIELSITHVVRGEDHVSNTAIQIQIFEALGGNIPIFAHNALIKAKEGKLSKRIGSAGVSELAENGIEPMAVASFLAKVGTSDDIEVRKTIGELIAEFDITKFGKSQTMYSVDDIYRLNTKLVHELDYAEVKGRLPDNVTSDFWLAVRPNIELVDEVKEWYDICHGDVKSIISDADKEFIESAIKLLPEGEWNEDTWSEWVNAVKIETGRKGKELFMPLRKALTAMEHGPELKVLLPLIGREKVISRLGG